MPTLDTYWLGSNPNISFTVTYDTYRSGMDVFYRFKITTNTISGASYFGYDLKFNFFLNGTQLLSDNTIKGSEPSRWTTPYVVNFPANNSYYKVANVGNAKTIPVDFKFFSNSGNSVSRRGNVQVIAPSTPVAPDISVNSSLILHTDRAIINLSGGSWGDGGTGTYYYQYNSGSGWKTFTFGLAKQVAFVPAAYGGTCGSQFQFRALASNSVGSATTKTVTVSCAKKPTAPSSFHITPNPMRRTQPLSLTWGASSAQDGTLSGYEISVRYHNGSSWSGWDVLAAAVQGTSYTTTPSDYSFFTMRPRGQLEYRVRAQNSYGLYSDFSTFSVIIKGGLAYLKVNDVWKPDCQVYIKVGGVWKESDELFVKTANSYKEAL